MWEPPIENTSWMSQGVELRDELLGSVAVSLKRIADQLDNAIELASLRQRVTDITRALEGAFDALDCNDEAGAYLILKTALASGGEQGRS